MAACPVGMTFTAGGVSQSCEKMSESVSNLMVWSLGLGRYRLEIDSIFVGALDEATRPRVGVGVVRCQWSGVSEWRVICPLVGVELY